MTEITTNLGNEEVLAPTVVTTFLARRTVEETRMYCWWLIPESLYSSTSRWISTYRAVIIDRTIFKIGKRVPVCYNSCNLYKLITHRAGDKSVAMDSILRK
ncbi:hypothetical protein CTI12_AA266190 [Artemisia annua]|uniref:Uncharacterized protein n=1 Tax=Artemisia annua TaxID=35608 RepID=A0A2U1NHB1_ARTAN|nr:hypothetical protein CTI12_AA266190 [Artemisia annua]